ncbi:hypothetical protein [Streptomyces sp. NPDC047928]|uniref:hypothetical protein n=1 Tax=unclassified Streptomyces TaxID=2593676 RepID=UPI00371EE787
MSGMPAFHFAGDAEVKRQTVGSVISEGVYHVSELHARAVALYGSALLLHQQVTTQIDGLRSRRRDYRSLAAAVAMLAVVSEVSRDSDGDLEKLLTAADAQVPNPENRGPGTLPLDIAQTVNGYGGGMILAQLTIRAGLLARRGMLRLAGALAPDALEALPAALEDLGVSVAEPAAEEAGAEVAAAFGEDAMEALSGASVAAAGLGFLVTAGVEIGVGWVTAEKDADKLRNAIDDYRKNIDRLTTYSRVVTARYNDTYAAIGTCQRHINDIVTALAPVFGPLGLPLPDPDPTRVAETLRVARQATRRYGLYADVRIQWATWRRRHGDGTAKAFVDWYREAAPEGVTPEQIDTCVTILRKYSKTFADFT